MRGFQITLNGLGGVKWKHWGGYREIEAGTKGFRVTENVLEAH